MLWTATVEINPNILGVLKSSSFTYCGKLTYAIFKIHYLFLNSRAQSVPKSSKDISGPQGKHCGDVSSDIHFPNQGIREREEEKEKERRKKGCDAGFLVLENLQIMNEVEHHTPESTKMFKCRVYHQWAQEQKKDSGGNWENLNKEEGEKERREMDFAIKV